MPIETQWPLNVHFVSYHLCTYSLYNARDQRVSPLKTGTCSPLGPFGLSGKFFQSNLAVVQFSQMVREARGDGRSGRVVAGGVSWCEVTLDNLAQNVDRFD